MSTPRVTSAVLGLVFATTLLGASKEAPYTSASWAAASTSLGWGVGAQTPAKSDPPPGVRNYTRVDATFACGGATKVEAFPALKQDGFASVINLRTAAEPDANLEGEAKAAREAGLTYIHIPFTTSAPDPGVVETFLKAVTDRANQPAYIHCASANRVGAVWLVKRVLVDGWAVEKATAEAEAIGLTSAVLKQFSLDYIKTHGK